MKVATRLGQISAGSSRSRQTGHLRSVAGLSLLTLMLGVLAASPLMNAQAAPVPAADVFSGKPRVVIISDIGNEPDDQMSFVRLLVYSNELDLEAMIATTSTWQKTATHLKRCTR